MVKNASPESGLEQIAQALHHHAIHLLRLVREADPDAGLTPARLSALSVVVFAGPLSLKDLAKAESVTPPTMSKLVEGLVHAGLVVRTNHPADKRKLRVTATAKGKALLFAARARRVEVLKVQLQRLDGPQRKILEEAMPVLALLTGVDKSDPVG